MLLGNLYRSKLIQDYQFGTIWDGLIVATRDLNVNMLTPNSPGVKKYIDISDNP